MISAESLYSDHHGKPGLSVWIPTYNRPERLRALLAVLLPQAAAHRVQVVILDNASDIPAERILAAFEQYRRCVKVIRNPCNVGGNVNVARCFELCETDWMWLLGDDDLPVSNAVELLLGQLSGASSSWCMLNWRSGILPSSPGGLIGCLPDVAAQSANRIWFSNFLFISSGVFNLNKTRCYLKDIYHYSYTCAPHLVAVLLACADGAAIMDLDVFLVNWEAPPEGHGWNPVHYLLGISTLADHPKLRAFSHTLVRDAVGAVGGSTRRMCKDVTRTALTCPSDQIDFWSGVCLRYAASARISSAFGLIWLFLLLKMLSRFPRVRKFARKKLGLQQVDENLSRT